MRAAAAVADNQIGDVGAAALAEGVKASRTLTELYLDGEFLVHMFALCVWMGGLCSAPIDHTLLRDVSAQITSLALRGSCRSLA